MKKLIYSALLFSTIFSCNKKEKVEDIITTEPKTEMIDNTTNVSSKNLKEFSSAQISDLLQRNGDTIYVTNFFATWCGPCMKEIPHFKEKMEELKGKPVKFTFVSLDQKEDWQTAVSDFADEYDLKKNIVLLDGNVLSPDFFAKNFKTWDGSSIPFTIIKKGDKSDETVGMMSKEELTSKLNSFK